MLQDIKIGIISGKKLTDALICHNLIKQFPQLKIIQYRVPLKMWFPWIWQRIAKMGLSVLIGHLLLSVYLRTQRKNELLRKKSLWISFIEKSPTWAGLPLKSRLYFSEKKLINNLNNVDLIIITDAFRFSHDFFRQIKVPCLQLIWGMAPQYLGDSAGFWAYLENSYNQIGVSIIQRSSSFSKLFILSQKNISVNEHEDLRTIKIKQANIMADLLPQVVAEFINRGKNVKMIKTKAICRIFQAPTIWTYKYFLQHHKINVLPKYSNITTTCTLFTKL